MAAGEVTARRGKRRGKPARREKRTDKTFSLHWGSGIIEEEVQIVAPYHVPTIQVLKFTAGPAAGRRAIRFCHYDARGRFQRSPLIVDEKDIETLAKALAKAPKLRAILAALGSLAKASSKRRVSSRMLSKRGL